MARPRSRSRSTASSRARRLNLVRSGVQLVRSGVQRCDSWQSQLRREEDELALRTGEIRDRIRLADIRQRRAYELCAMEREGLVAEEVRVGETRQALLALQYRVLEAREALLGLQSHVAPRADADRRL